MISVLSVYLGILKIFLFVCERMPNNFTTILYNKSVLQCIVTKILRSFISGNSLIKHENSWNSPVQIVF